MSKLTTLIGIAALLFPCVISAQIQLLDSDVMIQPDVTTVDAGEPDDDDHITPSEETLHMPFVANIGQCDEAVSFYTRTFGATILISRLGEITYSIPLSENRYGAATLVLNEQFVAGHLDDIKGVAVASAGERCSEDMDGSVAASSLVTYDFVDLSEVYPGIRIRLQAFEDHVQEVFCVAPGANPCDVRISLGSNSRVAVTSAGHITAEIETGTAAIVKLGAFQELADKQKKIDIGYVTDGDEYRFAVGDYDRGRPLTIVSRVASPSVTGRNRCSNWPAASKPVKL